MISNMCGKLNIYKIMNKLYCVSITFDFSLFAVTSNRNSIYYERRTKVMQS